MAVTLTRQWNKDAAGKSFRVVLHDNKPIGRLYQVRARWGGARSRVRLGFRFDFNGRPTRDPIVRQTFREIADQIERLLAVTEAEIAAYIARLAAQDAAEGIE